MTRHIADHGRTTTGRRLARFVQIERAGGAAGAHAAAQAVLRQPRSHAARTRLRIFLRIARGYET
jgi:serine/threonine protein kinase HipA of HipAB toxin-antitoxin module